MILAVLDSNTIVSAMLVRQGISARLLDRARAGEFTMVTSAAIRTEVFRVLGYARVRSKYHTTRSDIADLERLFDEQISLPQLDRTVHGVASHPEDDLILSTAVSGNADYLVTGDRDLQDLQNFEGIAIISPRRFLEILDSEQIAFE